MNVASIACHTKQVYQVYFIFIYIIYLGGFGGQVVSALAFHL